MLNKRTLIKTKENSRVGCKRIVNLNNKKQEPKK